MSGKGNASNRSTKAVHADKQQPGNNKGCNDVEGPDDPFEDEMITWLQYPLEDTFDRGYCSDLFGQWPPTVAKTPTSGGDQVSAGLSGNVRTATAMGNAGDEQHVGRGPSLRLASADAALALGAGRAAGLIPQADVEEFSKVRTSMQPPPRIIGSKLRNGGSFGAPYPSSQKRSGRSETSTVSSSMPPPKFRNASSLSNKLPLRPTQGGLRTFSSDCPRSPVGLRAVVSPNSNRKDDQDKVESIKNTALGSAISESSFFKDPDASRKVSDARLEFPSSQESGCSHVTEEATMKKATDHLADDSRGGQVCTTKGNVESSGISASAIMESQRPETKADVCEVPDIALASCSGGSQASADISTKEAFRGKGKMEDSECLSEEAEGESAETKHPRKRSSKRSRAAEVHNLSERKRRNRINEKMKALQDLIPNANKTDKASMLDEAIEYLKMLQSQLQMVSMRSGMSVPPMMIPSGMPHLQMPQMAPLHPIGLGVPVGRAGMGMGKGMMDWSHGVTGRPFPSLAAPLPHFNIPFQAAPTIVDTQNCSQTSNSTELCDFQALQQASPQLSEQLHLDPQNLMYYQLHHQQCQPCPPSHPRSTGMIESTNEQIVQREK